jgi:hypothetical protein
MNIPNFTSSSPRRKTLLSPPSNSLISLKTWLPKAQIEEVQFQLEKSS